MRSSIVSTWPYSIVQFDADAELVRRRDGRRCSPRRRASCRRSCSRTPWLNTSAPPPGIVSRPASRSATSTSRDDIFSMRAMCAISTAVSALMCTCGWSRLERAKHRRVVVEPRLHVEAADDVELARQAVARGRRFREHLLERVAIRAVFLRKARVRAEHARLAQDADVRRVDVLVGGERDAIAVLRAVHGVRERARRRGGPACGRATRALGVRESLARRDLVGDRAKRRIARCRSRLDRHAQRSRSVLEALDGERDVVPAEPEAVAERGAHFALRRRCSACSRGRTRDPASRS